MTLKGSKHFVSCTLQGITRNRNISVVEEVPLVISFSCSPSDSAATIAPRLVPPQVGCPVLMADEKKSRWKIPLGLVATGVAGAAVLVLRGCWHRKMSWPIRSQGHSYQVCLGCGIKRLFDESSFRAYGPYSYDLNRLISWNERHVAKEVPQRRPA
jgi:hypothetical protein